MAPQITPNMSRLIPSIDLSDVPSGSSPSTYESRQTWEKATLPAGSQIFDDWFGNVKDDDKEIDLDEISKEWSELEDQFYNQERQAGESEVEEIPDPTIYVTKAKSKPITIGSLDYVGALPSYPKSSSMGHGYLVDLRAGSKVEDIDVRIYCLYTVSVTVP